jgi:hypothetical protein
MGSMKPTKVLVITLVAGLLGGIGGALAFALLRHPERTTIHPIILEQDERDEDSREGVDRATNKPDRKGPDGKNEPEQDRNGGRTPSRAPEPAGDGSGGGAPAAPPAPPADAGDDDRDDDADDRDDGDDDGDDDD